MEDPSGAEATTTEIFGLNDEGVAVAPLFAK
jgi:hypothetical protein